MIMESMIQFSLKPWKFILEKLIFHSIYSCDTLKSKAFVYTINLLITKKMSKVVKLPLF